MWWEIELVVCVGLIVDRFGCCVLLLSLWLSYYCFDGFWFWIFVRVLWFSGVVMLVMLFAVGFGLYLLTAL